MSPYRTPGVNVSAQPPEPTPKRPRYNTLAWWMEILAETLREIERRGVIK